MTIKEKMQKMLDEKRAQEKALHEGLIAGETKEERAAIGETLAALRAEIADVESVIAELDEPAAGEEGARGALSVLSIAGGEQRAAVDPAEEYRSAWLKTMQGAALTDGEKRSIESVDVAGVIPVMTQNKIITKIKETVPLLDEIQLLNVAGSVKFAVEGTVANAAAHAENAELAAAEDTLIFVQLDGYEIAKFVRISATVKTMSISAFEDWLTEQLGRKVAEVIENYIINGTGSGQPKGIAKAAEWGDANSVTFAAAVPTANEIMSVISKLPSRFARGAKFVMNRKTFWAKVMPVRDDKKMPIVAGEGAGAYNIFGYPVLLSDFVADNEIYFGDLRMVVGNLADGITVEASAASGFRHNAIDYRGTAIFDCDIADAEAFVKAVTA